MQFNYKLYFKYILFFTNQIFLSFLFKNDKNTLITLSQNNLYYLSLHLKLSSLFYSTQLVDIFTYEIPLNKNNLIFFEKKNALSSTFSKSVLVYNFHSIFSHHRFFIFIPHASYQNFNKNSITEKNAVSSIAELFLNANWLEREVSELHGVFFNYKKDLRNLLLPYGDTSAPMLKSFPSVGTREIFYDAVNDLLTQNPVSIQF